MTTSASAGKQRLTQSPLLRTTFALCVVLLGIASVIAHGLEYRGVERFSKDFALDYSSAKAVLDGEDPYAPIRMLVGRYLDPPPDVLRDNILPGANWHTPFKLLVTLPLTGLPFRAAGVVWLLLCAACVVAAGFLLGRELAWSRRGAYLLGIGALGVPVVQTDLSAGNLNGPMLLLLVLAWRWLRRDRAAVAATMLGILVALKFFPALLALPLLGRRRIRDVGSAAAVAIALTLVGALVLGADHMSSFISAGGGDEGFAYWDTSPANISWWGIATRWLTPNGWVDAGVDAAALGVVLGIAGIAAALLLLLRMEARMSSVPFMAAVPLMLLAWPISWVHYLVLTLPWVVVAARGLSTRNARRGWWIAYGIVALVLMVGFPPGTPSLPETGSLSAALLYQLPTLALIGSVLMERTFNRSRMPVPEPGW